MNETTEAIKKRTNERLECRHYGPLSFPLLDEQWADRKEKNRVTVKYQRHQKNVIPFSTI